MFVTGGLAVWAMDQRIFWAAATFKPLTTGLLFAVLGKINSPLRRKVACGLVFSLLGDVALLGQRGVWFQLGLGAFLITHVCYILGFRPYCVWQSRSVPTAAFAILASIGTCVLAYPEAAKAGVDVAVAIYAAAITGTLVVTHATVGGELVKAKTAALGALLFYVADTCIAVEVFVPSLTLPSPAVFTTGLYWFGQYAIVVAARTGAER